MLRKIFSLAVALVIVLPFGVSCKPEPEPETADWDALYETALGWGYEGSFDEFVAILTWNHGDKDNTIYANKSAYEIYVGSSEIYTEEMFIDDVVSGEFNWWPVSYGFYTLEWAYNNKLLTKKELRSIAYYHHDGYKMGYSGCSGKEIDTKDYFFKPIPKNPKTLDEETESKVKQAYLDYHLHHGNWHSDYADTIHICEYLGTYNGYAAVMMLEPGGECAVRVDKIDDIYFFYSYSNYTIHIWKEKE